MVTQFRFIGHLQSVTFDFYDCEIFLMQFKSPYVIDVLAVTNIQGILSYELVLLY